MKQNAAPYLELHIFNGKRLDEGFIDAFELSEPEVVELNQKLEEASRRLDELSIQAASFQIGPGGTQLIVHVPSFPSEGGAVHDELLQAFAEVLGPEKYKEFSEISGDSVESAFGSFGLADTTYTMNLVPTRDGNGGNIYAIRETSSLPLGATSEFDSPLPAVSIPEAFPVLSHFIPSNSIQPKG
ncbi:MAG TPA: hypothetical protein VGG34_13445 [Opitutaceae bacterium]|jgi:hypothetical protein